MLAQQLIRSYGRTTCTPRSMMMIDLMTAFDSISWTFLLSLLQHLRFPAIMVEWIKECITSASFSISLNGRLHGFTKCKRGLRQGDPLSPYLFVLAMDYLSHSLKSISFNPNFNLHPKCDKIGLTNLAFVDDIILFARGDVHSVYLQFQTLIQFGQTTGLEINLAKSKLLIVGSLRIRSFISW